MMIWSFSSSRLFNKCQRQWYYKNCLANHRAKAPERREAYVLSKLQSIAAWRGNIVDDVVSKRVVPALNHNWRLNQTGILQEAKRLFSLQLQFARQHLVREQGMSPSKVGEAFAAFYDVEYDSGVSENDLAWAWKDVELALNNLFQMDSLFSALRASSYLIAQRALIFQHSQVSVRAVPDLIVFFENKPPIIIDWKVHYFGTQDYRLQLACYAIALTRCNPHKDFPASLSCYKATDIRLAEVQLLTNKLRKYTLSDTDIEDVDSYIAESAMQMVLAKGEGENGKLSPYDFPVTNNPAACQRCAFRSLCWETSS